MACWRIRAGILENVDPGVVESKTVSRDRGNEQLGKQPTKIQSPEVGVGQVWIGGWGGRDRAAVLGGEVDCLVGDQFLEV